MRNLILPPHIFENNFDKKDLKLTLSKVNLRLRNGITSTSSIILNSTDPKLIEEANKEAVHMMTLDWKKNVKLYGCKLSDLNGVGGTSSSTDDAQFYFSADGHYYGNMDGIPFGTPMGSWHADEDPSGSFDVIVSSRTSQEQGVGTTTALTLPVGTHNLDDVFMITITNPAAGRAAQGSWSGYIEGGSVGGPSGCSDNIINYSITIQTSDWTEM